VNKAHKEAGGAKRRRNNRKNGAGDRRREGIKTRVLLREIRRRRHRAAIFDALSNEVYGMFTSSMGDKPKYAVGDGERLIELADFGVVMTIAHEFAVRAQRDREVLAALIEMDVTDVTLNETLVATELDEQNDVDELVEVLFSTKLLGGERLRARNEKAKAKTG